MALPLISMTGNLSADPEIKYIQSGETAIPVTKFRFVATKSKYDEATRQWKDDAVCWVNVECWRGMAENAVESLKMGTTVTVVGSMRTREYVTTAGEKRIAVEIIDVLSISVDLRNQTAVVTRAARTNPTGNQHGAQRPAGNRAAQPQAQVAAQAPTAPAAPAAPQAQAQPVLSGNAPFKLDEPPF
jgi:single-strand DNA-binding protein